MCLFSGKYLPLYWEHQRYIYAFILIYISPFLFGTTKIYLCVYSHLHTSLFTGDNRNLFIRLFSLTYLPLYLEHLDIFMCLFSPTFSFHFYWEHHRYICVFIFTKIVSPPLRYILEDMSSCMFFPPTPPPFTVYTRGHIHLCNFSFLCSIFSIVVSTFSFDLCVFWPSLISGFDYPFGIFKLFLNLIVTHSQVRYKSSR